MRAGPLSDPRIISFLNSYFVPVILSTEEVVNPTTPNADSPAYNRLFADFAAINKPTGMVHVYLFTPDGKPMDALGVAAASNVDALEAFLRKSVQSLGLKPGPPVIAPKPLSAPSKLAIGSLSLHLVVRGEGQGSWREFPAENWVELDKADQKAILGPTPQVGGTWELDQKLAHKLLTNFYPATEDTNTKVNRNHNERANLRCKRIAGRNGVPMIRIDGKLEMGRSFYPGRTDYRPILAFVTGYVLYDQTSGEMTDLKLTTQAATFGEEPYQAGMQIVSPK